MRTASYASNSALRGLGSVIGFPSMTALYGIAADTIYGTFKNTACGICLLLEHPRFLVVLSGIIYMLFAVKSVHGSPSTNAIETHKSDQLSSLPTVIPCCGVVLILVGVACGLHSRNNFTAFFHKTLLWFGLPAIGGSLIVGYFELTSYQTLTAFVANNALLVFMLLSSIIRPDNMDEFRRQQLIFFFRTCCFVAFGSLVGLMTWYSENYSYTLVEGLPVVYAWLTAGVDYMNGTKHAAGPLALVPLPNDNVQVPVYTIPKKTVKIGLVCNIIFILLCVIFYCLKPADMETKFRDLLVVVTIGLVCNIIFILLCVIFYCLKPADMETKFRDLLVVVTIGLVCNIIFILLCVIFYCLKPADMETKFRDLLVVVTIGLVCNIIFILLCVIFYCLKPADMETKFRDLLVVVTIGLVCSIIFILLCVIFHYLKPVDMETKLADANAKFFDLLLTEFKDFDFDKKQEFKKYVHKYLGQ